LWSVPQSPKKANDVPVYKEAFLAIWMSHISRHIHEISKSMTFRDLLDEINLYGGVNAVYGIVYQVTWGQPESNQITYVGSKCLKGKWQKYRTSSKAAQQNGSPALGY